MRALRGAHWGLQDFSYFSFRAQVGQEIRLWYFESYRDII